MIPMASIGSMQMNGRVYGTAVLLVVTGIGLFGIKQINRFAIVFLTSVTVAIISIFVRCFKK